MSAIYPNSTTKLKRISETNNTLRGTLFGENTKNTSHYQAKGGIIEALRYLISCQSGASVALTRESPDGTYSVYFPFGLWTEAAQERRYHKKFTRNICCQKVVDATLGKKNRDGLY